MAEEKFSSPRVAPVRPKGSGSKAPWIVLALIVVAALALLASAGVALIILRG
jgi:hypothetical protein